MTGASKMSWASLLSVCGAIAVIGGAATAIIVPTTVLAEERQNIKQAQATAASAKESVARLETKVDKVLSAQHRTEVDIAGVQAAVAELKEAVRKREREAELQQREILDLLKAQSRRVGG